MPNKVKRYFAENNITVYYINATKIAQEIGLGNRTNTILQSLLSSASLSVIPAEACCRADEGFHREVLW
jgi:pyruvate-ferredoxin/flavodoxin oxidoreductase